MNLEDSVRALLVQACGTQQVLQSLGIILQPTRIPKDRFRTVDSILALVREYAG